MTSITSLVRGPGTINLYSIANYTFGLKEADQEKDTSVPARLARMEKLYYEEGPRRTGEDEVSGLIRKLNSKLAPVGGPAPDWEVSECVATWYRPNFETSMYPYQVPHITKQKEIKRIYLVKLPGKAVFAVPENMKLLAVPLFELYDNGLRYGPIIATLPQIVSKFDPVLS